MNKVQYKMRDLARDALVDKIFRYCNIESGLILYQLLTLNPLDMLVGILSAKLGLSKIVVTLILAFAL